jgi:predicted hotdog family 3-hydroxylacyl-ACP dehydratase
MPLDRKALERLLPHSGAMCLLDSVTQWDDSRIHCRAGSHRDPDHPLRLNGSLPALVAIEYAAQAMAVHGGVRAPPDRSAAPGYLVAARDVQLHAATLDDITTDLEISATCLVADSTGLVYAFAVSAGGRLVAEGRATVALRARDPLERGG